jgi:hypothetical protein
MANDAPREPEPAFKAENEVDLLLGAANPNPTREGCPPRETLIALARRQVPIGDPLWEHLSNCSPCFREMRAIQQAEGIRPADERRASRSWWPAAAAAVLVVAAGLAWFVYGGRQPVPTPAPEHVVAQAEPVAVTLDLRKYGVTRSDAPAEEPPPLVLPRAKVTLTLLLSVGSEPGDYEISVNGRDGGLIAAGRGRAEIRSFVATLPTVLDLTRAADGPVLLVVRRQGEAERSFPAFAK